MKNSSDPFYITTSIAYVNAIPHIGFAMESIQADVLARYHRQRGKEVFYLTGTDEHGSKMSQTAEQKGISAQELADTNAEKFRELKGLLNLSNDDFIRTSSDRHKRGASKLWKKLVEAGDIYKGEYKGYYCVGCENYVTEKELVDGQCPNHLKEPEVLSEENYFFKLSKYSDEIGRKIESGELEVIPNFRKNEILSLIKKGLKDVSFSRPKDILKWGVQVPDDDTQVMYVWCDALSNYITALDYENEGENYQKFWPNAQHLIGKDIIRFHAGIWIGMLLSASLPLPKRIYVHGFITSEGQKMSKSLGNVVDPAGMVEDFSADALRYYLLREIPTCDDGDFSQERFLIIYNSELVNNLGNLLSRVIAMSEKYLDGKIEGESLDSERKIWEKFQIKYDSYIDKFDLKKALELVMQECERANQFVEEKKPWVLAKEDMEQLAQVLYVLLENLRLISAYLDPFIPETSKKMRDQLGLSERGELTFGAEKKYSVKKGEGLFPRK